MSVHYEDAARRIYDIMRKADPSLPEVITVDWVPIKMTLTIHRRKMVEGDIDAFIKETEDRIYEQT